MELSSHWQTPLTSFIEGELAAGNSRAPNLHLQTVETQFLQKLECTECPSDPQMRWSFVHVQRIARYYAIDRVSIWFLVKEDFECFLFPPVLCWGMVEEDFKICKCLFFLGASTCLYLGANSEIAPTLGVFPILSDKNYSNYKLF
jgi:hypothetical protein